MSVPHPSPTANTLLRRAVVMLAIPTLAATAQDPLPTTASERAQWDAIVRAEDARAGSAAELATLRAGLRSTSVAIRRVATRAIGRLEQDALIADLAPRLADASPFVRIAAADAIAQAASRTGAPAARTALAPRVALERDASVRGALAEALGRITQGDTTRVRATSDALVTISRDARGNDAPNVAMFGVARGFFFLTRQPIARNALPVAAVARLTELSTLGRTRPATDTAIAREIREHAVSALIAARAANEALMTSMMTDPEPDVRRRVLPAASTPSTDSAVARRIVMRLLFDPAWNVRTLAVATYAQRFGAQHQCGPLLALAHDSVLTVRIAAADALAGGCELGSPATALLDTLTSRLPAPTGADGGAWHLPAHALVSLATLAPAQARARGWIDAFAASPDFFVREYAARAATKARDTTTLRRLLADAAPNVRTTAIAGLADVVGHAADIAYIAALGTADNQVVETAAVALTKSRDARAVPALLDALDRITALRQETWRDSRIAILDRVRELGDASQSARLRPYLADFDTLVAARSADILGAWSGTRPKPAPVALPRVATPTFAELQSLAAMRVRLEMSDGVTVVIRLHPFDAATNAARFARLAREGRLDGLTLHRAVPARLMQGGSPNANEYAGWGMFSREELWRPNRRGAVGLSTRGRDTGDGQLYINISDNFEFDHNYTVYGTVLSGMDAVDRMQEGARIRRATLVRD